MKPPVKILYVDDNPLDRELVRDALEKESQDFQIIEASSRQAFEALLEEDGFDLVLSDFNILGFEGLQVIEAVKARHPDLPVIILTGTGSEEIAVAAMRAGAADYVIKTPRHIQRLPVTIGAVLEKSQLEAEKARLTAELREARRCWEEIFQAIGHPAMILDAHHTIIHANRAAARAVGMSAAEMVGRRCFDIFHPELSQPPPGCPLEKLKVSGQVETTEMDMPNLRGTFLVSCTPMLSRDGQLQKVIHLATDITQHKQAEATLLEAEQQFRHLFDHANDGILIADLETKKFIMANPMICRMLGYTEEELQHLTVMDIHPPDSVASVLDCFERYQKQELTVATDLPVMRKDGTVFYASVSTFHLHSRGRLYLAAIFRDITARKQAEESLQESEEKYRTLFESSVEGFFLMTDVFLDCNEQACNLWKCSREDIVGRSPVAFSPEFQPDGRRSAEAAQEYITAALSGAPQFFYWQHRRKDGVLIDTEISLKAIRVGGRQILQATMRDITARRQAEAALRQSEERYRSLVENLNLGISEHHPSPVISQRPLRSCGQGVFPGI